MLLSDRRLFLSPDIYLHMIYHGLQVMTYEVGIDTSSGPMLRPGMEKRIAPWGINPEHTASLQGALCDEPHEPEHSKVHRSLCTGWPRTFHFEAHRERRLVVSFLDQSSCLGRNFEGPVPAREYEQVISPSALSPPSFRRSEED